MFSVAYVNGKYLPYNQAFTHIEDRGYQLADGVYEVALMRNGKLLDAAEHFERLERSLREMQMHLHLSIASLKVIINEVIERSGKTDSLIYVQVTRGIASRDHSFPANVKPSVVVYLLKLKMPTTENYEKGVKIITTPETRWARRDIKSISLLPNALAKQKATEAKAKEAVFVDDKGFITEGSSMNLHIVDKNGSIITHPADNNILGGVTRLITLKVAREAQIKVEERPFSLQELYGAAEVFLTSTSAGVLPVVTVDDKTIAGGKPGKTTARLIELYNANVEKQLAA